MVELWLSVKCFTGGIWIEPQKINIVSKLVILFGVDDHTMAPIGMISNEYQFSNPKAGDLI